MMTLGDALTLLPGARLVGDPALRFARVHSDSRSLRAGDLFVALRGERFDGNDFIAQALEAGAAAALAHPGRLPVGASGLEVADTRAALLQLAAGWRRHYRLPLVAVVGSNGKTTVTQMIGAILRVWHGGAALVTQGNLNNDIGLPLMLLRLADAHRAAVLELGMNHPGEIARLAACAQPTVALINNAQREHQEFMASVEAVARENGSVIDALPADGRVVIPADDAFAPLWRGQAGARRVIDFAMDGGPWATVQGAGTWDGETWALDLRTPAGRIQTGLQAPGRHNLRNALAATAGAIAAGAPGWAIAAGLAAFRPVAGRSQARRLSFGGRLLTLVDDSYNANPDSVRAAIELLAALPGPRVLVLGDMGEVGDQGPAFHAEVGDFARHSGIDRLVTLGELTRACGGRHFEDAESLCDALPQLLGDAQAVLVKGSRFMRMERVVRAIDGLAAVQAASGEMRHAA